MEKVKSYKEIKKLLVSIGFHCSWGYWISDKNKKHRIHIKPSRRINKKIGHRTYSICPTKHGNYIRSKYGFRIIPTETILNEVKEHIMEFFLNPMKDNERW